jgi:hypothetical protein
MPTIDAFKPNFLCFKIKNNSIITIGMTDLQLLGNTTDNSVYPSCRFNTANKYWLILVLFLTKGIIENVLSKIT